MLCYVMKDCSIFHSCFLKMASRIYMSMLSRTHATVNRSVLYTATELYRIVPIHIVFVLRFISAVFSAGVVT